MLKKYLKEVGLSRDKDEIVCAFVCLVLCSFFVFFLQLSKTGWVVGSLKCQCGFSSLLTQWAWAAVCLSVRPSDELPTHPGCDPTFRFVTAGLGSGKHPQCLKEKVGPVGWMCSTHCWQVVTEKCHFAFYLLLHNMEKGDLTPLETTNWLISWFNSHSFHCRHRSALQAFHFWRPLDILRVLQQSFWRRKWGK